MYKVNKQVITYEEAWFETISDAIAYKVKTLRKNNKLTQDELCKKLGISRASVSNIEQGRHNITLEILEKLCKVFGVSSDELLPF